MDTPASDFSMERGTNLPITQFFSSALYFFRQIAHRLSSRNKIFEKALHLVNILERIEHTKHSCVYNNRVAPYLFS